MLCLSNADIRRLQAATTTLLSALEFESVDAWAAQAMADVMAVLGADKAYFALPAPGVVYTAATGERADDGRTAYLAYYWTTDLVLMQRRVEMGLEVYHRDMLYHPGEMARDELHNDWCVPHGLHDTLGMGFDVERGQRFPALLHLYHHRDSTKSFGEHGVGLLELLLPAFKAGVAAWRTLHDRRSALAGSLDAIGVPLALFDPNGTLAHRTPALTGLLDAEIDRNTIEQEVGKMARDVTASAWQARRRGGATPPLPSVRTICTRAARYAVRGCLAPHDVAGGPMAIITVERVARPGLDVNRIARAYGFTARETAVSLLLARGESTSGVARALGVSRHTARHHVEHIMIKLGVHSRAELVVRLIAL